MTDLARHLAGRVAVVVFRLAMAGAGAVLLAWWGLRWLPWAYFLI